MSNKRANGLNPHNDVSSDINRVAYGKTMTTIRLNDEWRKLCEEDPTLPFRISFLEWRKKKLRVRRGKGRTIGKKKKSIYTAANGSI